jgi:3'-5' exoribonuclease
MRDGEAEAGGPVRFAALVPAEVVAGHARVVAGERATARTGAPFHRLVLADATGSELTARRFDVGEEAAPPVGCVVRVTGVVELYRDRRSLNLTVCVVAPEVPAAAFRPRVPATRAATPAEFDALVAGIADPGLRGLVETCLVGAERDRFALMPAAVRHHGAAVGGLLAHTVRVARIALALTEIVGAGVDRDVVLAAALLHDLGKLDELVSEPGAGVTPAGTLVGHVGLGLLRVAAAAERVSGLTPERRQAVLHAVLAAHGRVEHGAPVVPATVEALIVHLADLAEATLAAAQEATERAEPGAGWTPYLPRFGTRLRVPGR